MSTDKYPKRVMLATDGSKHSLHAAQKAAQMAKSNDSEVIIVHVLNPYMYLTSPLGPMDVDGTLAIENEKEVKKRGKAAMEASKKIFDDLSVNVETRFLRGNVARAIVDEAIKEKVDLIVVGATGYGGVTEWLLGSTAHKIARNSPCPVMIVR
ncbi:universal stress protein [Candidatus Bathyarchaeota archaeon]|nr:universal stress protein [Candidatus Bathyarchaeota archaeon]